MGGQRGPHCALSDVDVRIFCFHVGLKASLFQAQQSFMRLNLGAEFLE